MSAINGPAKMLVIFIGESDQHGELPLYEAILRRLLHHQICGATANSGIMGYGSHHHLHRKRLFGVSDDRPITITAIDSEEKLRRILPEIRPLIREGMVVLLDVEVV